MTSDNKVLSDVAKLIATTIIAHKCVFKQSIKIAHFDCFYCDPINNNTCEMTHVLQAQHTTVHVDVMDWHWIAKHDQRQLNKKTTFEQKVRTWEQLTVDVDVKRKAVTKRKTKMGLLSKKHTGISRWLLRKKDRLQDMHFLAVETPCLASSVKSQTSHEQKHLVDDDQPTRQNGSTTTTTQQSTMWGTQSTC